jgi:hypothetical protein
METQQRQEHTLQNHFRQYLVQAADYEGFFNPLVSKILLILTDYSYSLVLMDDHQACVIAMCIFRVSDNYHFQLHIPAVHSKKQNAFI